MPGSGSRFNFEALLYSPSPGGEALCALCPHRCVIPSGARGLCGVRENRNGTLFALTYGRPAARGVEPIEKKPFFHFHPGSLAYSVGTHGCNMRCAFCINAAISQTAGEVDAGETVTPEEIVAAAVAAGCDSVALTYVEPTIFFEYALDIAGCAREAGLAVVMKTNGFITPEALALLAPRVDAANVDLKAFRSRSYERMGGQLGPVLDCLRFLRAAGVWIEVTTVLIPGVNDDAAELGDIAGFIASELGPDTPWHVARFFPAFQMLDTPPTSGALLDRAREIGRAQGLRHVYLANDLRPGSQETCCAGCGTLLIRRSGGRLLQNDLDDGACPACGEDLAGRGLVELRATARMKEERR